MNCSFVSTLKCCCFALGMHILSVAASGQLILRDDFDGSGIVDPAVWRLPFDTEGNFVGRTQYRGNPSTDMPLQGVAEPLASDGKVLEIDLDTFSPIDPGNQFLGTDILTKRNFARAGGLTIEARMRLKPTSAGGTVGGFFLYDVQRDDPPGSGNQVRDEIDWELLGNQVAGGTQNPASNYWNDGPFSGPGSGGDFEFHSVSGFDLTQFHDYRVEWAPGQLQWFVDNTLVRTETSNIPDDPMKLHFNLWAPDSDFSQAFDAALQPVASAGDNTKYQVQVDHVEVNRVNTTATELLVDGSFETEPIYNFGFGIPGDVDPAKGTGDWIGFGNTPFDTLASDGFSSLKLYGPFNGSADASGVWQNAAASPGQEFEASVMAYSPSNDSILRPAAGDFNADGAVNIADYTVWRNNFGASTSLPNDTTGEATVGAAQYELWQENFGNTASSENYTQLVLTFHDANGDVLQEAFADPGNLVNKNAQDVPIFDGRDPNLGMLEDQWIQYQVNAIAPAGTSFVRWNLYFVQLNSEGGAVIFDEASLLRLDSTALSSSLATAGVPEPTSALLLVFAAGTAYCLRRVRSV